VKAAESDALKRAFVTFGNVFGLALYDKAQRNVGTPEQRQISAPDSKPMAPIDEGFDQSQPERQTTSQRALAASPRPPSARPNGRDHSTLPY
jgi:recombination DNA repair RAD52 pathway protein